jgi:uncharacterized membrane protein YeaQ/YmgE (transglycosylase-associated protein family)
MGKSVGRKEDRAGENSMMNIVSTVISGVIIGILARFLYPGTIPMGLLMTCVLGVAGSLLAGLAVSRGKVGEGFHKAGFVASLVGALLLIFIGHRLGIR